MSQKLVTKKNAKVRMLRRLYPEVRCKIFYQRDYLNLVEKYGLEEPDNLSSPSVPEPPTRTPQGGPSRSPG